MRARPRFEHASICHRYLTAFCSLGYLYLFTFYKLVWVVHVSNFEFLRVIGTQLLLDRLKINVKCFCASDVKMLLGTRSQSLQNVRVMTAALSAR
jgi:hypothetical protein